MTWQRRARFVRPFTTRRKHNDPGHDRRGLPVRRPLSDADDRDGGGTVSAFDRLMAKVSDTENCWTWVGSKHPAGYGQMWNGVRVEQAHRISFRIFNGEIPAGFEIDHICRNRGCVNPDHLRAVTHRENMRASDALMGVNARKTSCKRGHPLAGDNLFVSVQGARQCRECLRMHARNARSRRKQCTI